MGEMLRLEPEVAVPNRSAVEWPWLAVLLYNWYCGPAMLLHFNPSPLGGNCAFKYHTGLMLFEMAHVDRVKLIDVKSLTISLRLSTKCVIQWGMLLAYVMVASSGGAL